MSIELNGKKKGLILYLEKRFVELQNELQMEKTKKKISEGVYWWYEAWDATWKLYDSRMIEEIEDHYQKNQLNVKIKTRRFMWNYFVF